MVGGTLSAAASGGAGGSFLSGFVGAFGAAEFGGGIDPNSTSAGVIALRTTAAAVVGGTASELAGGSFANGAWSAAFQQLFNEAETAAERARFERLRRESGVSFVRGKDGTVYLIFPDGTVEVRSGGSVSWRNNNPGNVRLGSMNSPVRDFAIGQNEGFAVFSVESIGREALAALLHADYKGLTINQAIAKFAPPTENNTAAYQSFIRSTVRVSGSTNIDSLNGAQFNGVMDAIQKEEGWHVGRIQLWNIGALP